MVNKYLKVYPFIIKMSKSIINENIVTPQKKMIRKKVKPQEEEVKISTVEEVVPSVIQESKIVEEEKPTTEEFNFSVSNENLNIEFIQSCFNEIIQKLNTDKNNKQIIKNLKLLKKHVELLNKKKKSIKKTTTSNNTEKKKAGLEQENEAIPELIAFYKELHPEQNKKTFSRIEITRILCDYIKKNNLQNSENRTLINPDEKLIKLLKLKTEKELVDQNLINNLKYSTLQKPIKYLFVKKD